jgi:tetratricopeptide (TPR) repeat protein
VVKVKRKRQRWSLAVGLSVGLVLSLVAAVKFKDYREADHYFKTIREQCPNSEFVPASYVLGAHSSLQSYQGSRYDGKQLEEAKKLTQAAVRIPDIAQRPKLEYDLKKIDAEGAKRRWVRVEFYLKRREKISAAVYCEKIIENHPDSPEAAKARDVLLALGPQYAAGILKTPLFKKDAGRTGEPEPSGETPEEPARLRVVDGDISPISEAK